MSSSHFCSFCPNVAWISLKVKYLNHLSNQLALHSQTKHFLSMLEIFPNTYTYNLSEKYFARTETHKERVWKKRRMVGNLPFKFSASAQNLSRHYAAKLLTHDGRWQKHLVFVFKDFPILLKNFTFIEYRYICHKSTRFSINGNAVNVAMELLWYSNKPQHRHRVIKEVVGNACGMFSIYPVLQPP